MARLVSPNTSPTFPHLTRQIYARCDHVRRRGVEVDAGHEVLMRIDRLRTASLRHIPHSQCLVVGH